MKALWEIRRRQRSLEASDSAWEYATVAALPRELSEDLAELNSTEFARKHLDRNAIGSATLIADDDVEFPRLRPDSERMIAAMDYAMADDEPSEPQVQSTTTQTTVATYAELGRIAERATKSLQEQAQPQVPTE